jgi:hypothetical protein
LNVVNDWVVFDKNSLSKQLWLEYHYYRCLSYSFGLFMDTTPPMETGEDIEMKPMNRSERRGDGNLLEV